MQLGNGAVRPEIWAGIECTVNRVGDRYHDQLARSGHDHRPDDMDCLARLGVRAVRYPVLWERHEADPAEWERTDERLARLRSHGVRPILGLVHHGSGPPHTSLANPNFADGLASFATRVAARYPWVEAYTPVNEPLTTARFAGLYGHWYPHGRDDSTFVRCLLNQCRAATLAMQAVRAVNPDAQLIQTEDLGQTHAPLSLAYQAEFENERRWLSWDLLCGRVDDKHPLRGYLAWAGAADHEMNWLLENTSPPDVFGVNYYVTSERYLDDRLELYPEALHGSNGKQRYVDAAAVRVLSGGPLGPDAILRQVWDRYRRPIAVTEAHLGCTREEQLRWLADVWKAACDLRETGGDVRAVTAWSAFGAYDWDSLVTRDAGRYETGVFDVRTNPPRLTAVAALVGQLAAGSDPAHPVLATPGWWRRPERLSVPDGPRSPEVPTAKRARPILLTGGTGSLGSALLRICARRGLAVVAPPRSELDVTDAGSAVAALARYQPWAVVNAAEFGGVDAAEADAEGCRLTNAHGPAVLATACAASGIAFVNFSSDLVFDGRTDHPYREDDATAPLSVYGAAKAEADRRVLALHPAALIVRAGGHFGPWDGQNFLTRALAELRAGGTVAAAADLTVTPAYLPDLIDEALDLLVDGEVGVWHLAPPESVTWADLARSAARCAGLDASGVRGVVAASFAWPAQRPVYSALATGRGTALPPLANALARFVHDFTPVLG